MLGVLGLWFVGLIVGAVCAAASITTTALTAKQQKEQAEKAQRLQEAAQEKAETRQKLLKKLNLERAQLATRRAQQQIGGAIALNHIRAQRARYKTLRMKYDYGKPIG